MQIYLVRCPRSLRPTRLPNGNINLCAFGELAAIVSAFTFHMSNVPLPAGPAPRDEFNYLVNHILTSPLRDENGKVQSVLTDCALIASRFSRFRRAFRRVRARSLQNPVVLRRSLTDAHPGLICRAAHRIIHHPVGRRQPIAASN